MARPRRPAASKRRLPQHVSDVERGPFAQEVADLVEARWPPASIERWLRMRYGGTPELLAKIPSRDSLQRFVKAHSPRASAMIPASILHELIGRTEAMVDVMSYYEALVPLLANRLGEAIKLEQGLGGMLTDQVDKAASTFLSAAKQLWDAGQDLGMYPSKPVAPHLLLGIDVNAGADTNLSDREATAMWEAIYRVRHGEELPELESPRAKARREALEGEDGTE